MIKSQPKRFPAPDVIIITILLHFLHTEVHRGPMEFGVRLPVSRSQPDVREENSQVTPGCHRFA